MDVPKIPGDVLAQPTRARLFARLGELGRAASTDELANELGLHRNGVRMHLDRLAEAGLVVRERERRPQGTAARRVEDQSGRAAWRRPADGVYGPEPLAGAEHVRRQDPACGMSRRRDGRSVANWPPKRPATTAEGIRDVLGALGFQPTSTIDREGTLTYTLANCPYRDAVRENQTVVCALHRGLTRGLLDEMSPRTKLAGFVPKDPYTAGCLIQLKGPLADEAAITEAQLASAAPRASNAKVSAPIRVRRTSARRALRSMCAVSTGSCGSRTAR